MNKKEPKPDRQTEAATPQAKTAEALELLLRSVSDWNRYRKAHPDEAVEFNKRDFRELDLSGADLSGASFKAANFSGANLGKVSFRDMMAKDKAKRYQDPSQVAADIELVIKGGQPKGPREEEEEVLVAKIEGQDDDEDGEEEGEAEEGKPTGSKLPDLRRKRRPGRRRRRRI